MTPASDAVGGLEELAAACERATGPDRELDTDILIALHPGSWRKAKGEAFIPEKGWEPGSYSQSARTYTASLDAAMTLVPEGATWSVTDPANRDGSKSVFGYPSRAHASVAGSDREHHYAVTPALALCVAALRARAYLQEQSK